MRSIFIAITLANRQWRSLLLLTLLLVVGQVILFRWLLTGPTSPPAIGEMEVETIEKFANGYERMRYRWTGTLTAWHLDIDAMRSEIGSSFDDQQAIVLVGESGWPLRLWVMRVSEAEVAARRGELPLERRESSDGDLWWEWVVFVAPYLSGERSAADLELERTYFGGLVEMRFPLRPHIAGMVMNALLTFGLVYAAVTLVSVGVVWNRRRRSRCASCGYRLVEISSERCPECGAVV